MKHSIHDFCQKIIKFIIIQQKSQFVLQTIQLFNAFLSFSNSDEKYKSNFRKTFDLLILKDLTHYNDIHH